MAKFSSLFLCGAAICVLAGNARAAVILVKFGDFIQTESAYNYFPTGTKTGVGATSLSYSTGTGLGSASGATLEFTRFSGQTGSGPGQISGAAATAFPTTSSNAGTVANTGFFGDAVGGSSADQTGTTALPYVDLIFKNFSAANTYKFTFFSGRAGVPDPVDLRTTQFVTTGLTSDTEILNATNNSTNVVSTAALLPDLSGQIVVRVSAAATNNNANKFYYINDLRIDTSPVPEPAFIGIVTTPGVSVLARRRRRRRA